jgi:hypothetical protein
LRPWADSNADAAERIFDAGLLSGELALEREAKAISERMLVP